MCEPVCILITLCGGNAKEIQTALNFFFFLFLVNVVTVNV